MKFLKFLSNRTKLILIVLVILAVSGSVLLFFVLNNESFFIEKRLQTGDIVFQTSKSMQSKAIQLAIRSKYSHMGMIFMKSRKPYVLEAVQPVKLTPFGEWMKQGVDDHVVVKRLKESETLITRDVKKKMIISGSRFLGKNLDFYFEWSDEKMYSSELVWKIYKEAAGIEIGKLEKLKDLDLSSEIIKNRLTEKYGDNIPMDETVISPASILDSERLYTVTEK